MPTPKPPILGASAVSPQSYEFAQIQPSRGWYERGYGNRRDVRRPLAIDIDPIQQSYVFAVGQPVTRRRLQIGAARAITETIVPVSQPQTYEFFPAQPELRWYHLRQQHRFDVGVTPAVHTGATTEQTYIFPLSQPYFPKYRVTVAVVPWVDTIIIPPAFPRILTLTTWNVPDTLVTWNTTATCTTWNVPDTIITTES